MQYNHLRSGMGWPGAKRDLTTRAGLPAATEYGGMDFVTTAPAPIIEPWPIVTPGRMMTLRPIQQSSSITIGRGDLNPC